MGALLRSIQNYLLEKSDVSYDDLVEAFGTPEEIAEVLIDKLSAAELYRYQRYKRIGKWALIVLIGLGLLWSIYILIFAVVPVEVTQTIIIE